MKRRIVGAVQRIFVVRLVKRLGGDLHTY
jgi:hypothetical protein